jgi:hypothetical protein
VTSGGADATGSGTKPKEEDKAKEEKPKEEGGF